MVVRSARMFARLGVLATLAVLCGWAGQPNALAQDRLPNPETLYARNCASCHGLELQGSGLGPALNTQTYRYGGAADDLRRIIANGVIARGMPGFAATLSAEEIDALVAWLPVRTPQQASTDVQDAADGGGSNGARLDDITETLDYAIRSEVWVDGLDTVWALAFIDDDTALATERPGRLRVIESGVLVDEPVAGTPPVLQSTHEWNQGGLLDVAIDPDYADTGWVYLSFADPRPARTSGGEPVAMTRVVRGRIRDNQWVDQETVFEAEAAAYSDLPWHFGGRMAIDQDGYLYVAVGDRGARETARETALPHGKIHRVARDGTIPSDNPFVGVDGALPTTFTQGNRNPQGLAVHPETGVLWQTEHGPRGGDELNILRSGADYGWPVISHGINYDGTVLTPDTHAPGMEQPVYFWRPSIGLSGLAVYQGAQFPLWQGKLLVTSLGRRDLRLLTIEDERVMHEEIVYQSEGRPYEPVVGPDGAIYLVTSDPGQIVRLSAEDERRQ